MIQIRRNVFETNSSSTHSIAVPLTTRNYDGKSITFTLGEFGWEFDSVNPADYFYTAIWESNNRDEYIEQLKHMLDNHNISYEFYGHDGYIDHSEDAINLAEYLLNDEDRLLSFLFDGYVFTANDNSNNSEGFLERNQKYLYDWNGSQKENPYYDEKFLDYDWYYKDN